MNLSLDELQGGDQKAFEVFFDYHYDQLCNYAYSILRNMDDAEDVVQKSFFKLWDQRNELLINSSILSYLYRMIHNECLNDSIQKKRHSSLNFDYVNATMEFCDDVNNHMEYSDLQKAVNKSLSSLPTQCRKAFELSRMNHMSYKEIAEELSITTNTVENHIAKALKILRVDLKEFIS